MPENDVVLKMREITKNFPGVRALDKVSIDLKNGEILGLLGENGAGKSTILHAIFGFNRIFSGSIEIGSGSDKMDVTRLTPNQKLAQAGIAYILQDKSIFPAMTVEENLWPE